MKHLIFILLLSSHGMWAQLKNHTFEEAEAFKDKKNIVVFLNTSWCKYCKVMENTTFKNKDVIETLNKDFYFISFNAETPEPITYLNHTFKYKKTGKNVGVHELAQALGTYNGTLSYPTTVILNSKQEIIFQYPYVLNHKRFIKVLKQVKQ